MTDRQNVANNTVNLVRLIKNTSSCARAEQVYSSEREREREVETLVLHRAQASKPNAFVVRARFDDDSSCAALIFRKKHAKHRPVATRPVPHRLHHQLVLNGYALASGLSTDPKGGAPLVRSTPVAADSPSFRLGGLGVLRQASKRKRRRARDASARGPTRRRRPTLYGSHRN